MPEKIIGIDLGTSNSAAAVVIGGRPVIIPSSEGVTLYGKAFPSYVAITKDGQLLVGEPARRQAVMNPEGTVTAFKRKMGTDYKYVLHGKEFTPQQLSAFLLQKIKRDAEAFLGEPVKKAVITVPAYFNDNQRQATKDAGTIAGLEVVRIINEPTAASLAYGLDKQDKEMRIMVFDLGGGTLDVTILEFGGGVFEVKATSGDTQLGGTDMDKVLVDYIVNKFKQDTGIDLTRDPMAMNRVREAAEKAKIELSTVYETEINLPFIAQDSSGPKHLTMTLTRAKLEELVRPIVERCAGPMRQALADAKLRPEDIDKIILVGGPTRMPIVREFVKNFMGKEPERGIDPMECVAMGAAIQGAIIAGEIKDVLLLDVTPLSLGIETLGGIFTKIIERNTTIPVRRSQIFTTAADFQTSVEIHVLQGERPMAADNISLGRFVLDGIPPAPRGVPRIEVTFDIDVNGILTVTAKDLGTGKDVSVKITAPHRLSKEEIDRMIKEAEMYAEQDRKKKEEAELRNEAESLVYTIEKALKDFGDKVPNNVKSRVEESLKKLKNALADKDVQEIKNKMEELKKVAQEMGTVIYQQSAQQSSNSSGSKTIDADYKVVNDNKKN
ncbi:MAG: molecular chaperone DnaK [Thaumarchaeota archaeon]|jgi:molecular chaperone DnaK|nr:molecular chaperone DnaK [Candidatus Terraquivivens yellowstonensis]MCL7397641.1 molecular chaperone DnaK [Candidatus Terraquivivens yellowstonensis]MCL7400625.1 molecular chaperone DnaK [Candidatus Terraquivivens yellowstonensis]